MQRFKYLQHVAVAMTSALFVGCSGPKPTVWYCQAYNVPNHQQYKIDDTGDRGWSRVHESLGSCVHWRVDAEVPTAERLRDVDLVVILNPEAESWEGGPAPHLMNDEEVDVLVDYVEGGGALLFMSNQDEKHNIEKPRTNRLLEHFGMRMGQGDIGLKILDIAEGTPVVGGLCWRFFFGSPVEMVNGTPARVWGDASALDYKYDRHGNLTVLSFIGRDGRCVDTSLGYAVERRIFDDKGRLLQTCLFRADGTPAILRKGIMSDFGCRLWIYGDSTRPKSLRFLSGAWDRTSVPVKVKRSTFKVGLIEFEHGPGDRLIEQRLYSPEGELPIMVLDCQKGLCPDPYVVLRGGDS